MLPSTYEEQHCAIARSLEIVGERWTLLIVRDALLGIRRFEDFQSRLGISRAVLTDRLSQLVQHDVLERVRYQRRPDRYEYLLTARGRLLWPVMAALAEWGAPLSPGGPPREFRHRACAAPVHPQVTCAGCRAELSPDDVVSAATPGAAISRARHIPRAIEAALSRERRLLEPIRDPPASP